MRKFIEPRGSKGIIFLIIFTLFFAVGFIIMFNQSSGDLLTDGKAVYDKKKMNEYIKTNYENEFKDSATYEDNIILFFLYNEDYNEYLLDFYIGYDLSTSIYKYLNTYSNSSNFDRNFDTSNCDDDIEKNLSNVINEITINLDNNFDEYLKCNHTNDEYISKVTNSSHSELDITEIERSLINFTDTTGLSIVLVIDSMENVFGKTKDINYEFLIIFGTIVLCFLMMMVYAFIIVIKNTLNDKKKYNEIEKKKTGIKQISGIDYHSSDNDNFNNNTNDYK